MTLRKRIERLEARQARPGAIPRWGEPRDWREQKADWDAHYAQYLDDLANGVSMNGRAEIDLARNLARYPHPDDRAEILHWHEVRIRNIEQWEALEPRLNYSNDSTG